MKPPVALTIAGSDSGGGAGIQADLKTFAALGVHGTSALTAVTAQNTLGVGAVHELPVEIVEAQIAAVAEDLRPAAVKTGMLSSAAIIETVAAALERWSLQPLVVDPVMVAKGGARLLREDAVKALRTRILPLAAVVTPNLPEAEVLLGLPPGSLRTLDERREAARELVRLGAAATVVKGGHAAQDAEVVDVFFDGTRFLELPGRRVATASTHGSGCVFSAAITAHLARGEGPAAAVTAAKAFIQAAVEQALEIGGGHGPVNPMHGLT